MLVNRPASAEKIFVRSDLRSSRSRIVRNASSRFCCSWNMRIGRLRTTFS